MALDNKLTKGFMALAKARNKFNLKLHKEMVAESKRLKRQEYEARQGGNNGMWGMAATGAAIGTMFPGIGTVAGGLGGLALGAITEGYQNKKTAEQYGKKGYGWNDAIGDLVRPPNLNEASQMAMAAAQMGAMKMNAGRTRMPGSVTPQSASASAGGGGDLGFGVPYMPAPVNNAPLTMPAAPTQMGTDIFEYSPLVPQGTGIGPEGYVPPGWRRDAFGNLVPPNFVGP